MNKLLLACLAMLTAQLTMACCMVPATYQGSISQDAQEAVLIHDGKRQELVLRINYRITGKQTPDTFAWVITTPKEPDAYALADAALFDDMFALSQQLVVPPSKGRSIAAGMEADSIPQGVELGKRVQVGPYDIQPIRGVGPQALIGLNTWLRQHGFPIEEPDHMSYFVTHGFTFLCVRITPPAKQTTVAAKAPLPPLQLSLTTPSPYYPLRFSSRQGVFDVNLHILTRAKLDYTASAATLTRINWARKEYKRNVSLTSKAMPDTLKAVFAKSPWQDQIGQWHYNNLRCAQVNKGNTIRTWKEDITFATN